MSIHVGDGESDSESVSSARLQSKNEYLPLQEFGVDRQLIKNHGHHHRGVPEIELFFDLVFVAAIGVLSRDFASSLHHHVTLDARAFQDVFALWTPLFFSWMYLSFWSNRFYRGINDVWTFGGFALMFVSLAGVTINIRTCASHNYEEVFQGIGSFRCMGYSIFILCARVVLMLIWLRSTIKSPARFKTYLWYQTITQSMPILFWTLNLIFNDNNVVFLVTWWLAVLWDFTMPFANQWTQLLFGKTLMRGWADSFVPIDVYVLTERMGLLLIVALGEVVVAGAFPLASDHLATTQEYQERYASGFCILVMSLCFYLLQFAGQNIGSHRIHALKVSKGRGFLWILLFHPIIVLVVLMGASAEASLDELPARMALSWCIGLLLMFLSLQNVLHKEKVGRDGRRRCLPNWILFIVQMVAAAVAFFFMILDDWINPLLWLAFQALNVLICTIICLAGSVKRLPGVNGVFSGTF